MGDLKFYKTLKIFTLLDIKIPLWVSFISTHYKGVV